jgi:hypothetical protein
VDRGQKEGWRRAGGTTDGLELVGQPAWQTDSIQGDQRAGGLEAKAHGDRRFSWRAWRLCERQFWERPVANDLAEGFHVKAQRRPLECGPAARR